MSIELIKILEGELQRRKIRNSNYSLRNFAKDLGISKSTIHDIIAGKTQISKASQSKILENLNLNDSDKKRIQDFQENRGRKEVPNSEFSEICHWYHLAILSLADTVKAKSSPHWVAKKLQMSAEEARQAINKLKSLGMIKINKGVMRRNTDYMSMSDNVPSWVLRNYHSENLMRADKALIERTIDERELTSITAMVSKEQYQDVLIEAKKFREKVMAITDKKEQTEMVYTIALQVFPQTYS